MQPWPAQAAPQQVLARADRTAQAHATAPDGLAALYGPARAEAPAPLPDPAQPGDAARHHGGTRRDGPSRYEDTARYKDTAGYENTGRLEDSGPHEGTGAHHGLGRRQGTGPGNGDIPRDGAVPGEEPGRPHRLHTADNDTPGGKGSARRAAPRLSGANTLDPARNPRYLRYVLRQAGVFSGIYLLIETVLLLCLLLAVAAGTKFGPALRLEMGSLWLVALVLAIPFWLIPVPALLAEWSLVMEQSSAAAQTAFEHINSAFQAQGTPVDSVRTRSVSPREEGNREYLELRRDHFSGYISCFAHGRDLYVGWTFWLHMSPLRLLMMVIGRNIQDVTSRGDGIHRSLRFESTRALVAAMHGATLAGINAASSELDPVGPQPVRETAIDTNYRLG